MDTTQLLLTTTLVVTTIFLIAVGIQLIFVLREIRRVFNRINNIVEGFEKLGHSVEHGLTEAFGFMTGIKTLFKVLDTAHKRRHGASHKKSS